MTEQCTTLRGKGRRSLTKQLDYLTEVTWVACLNPNSLVLFGSPRPFLLISRLPSAVFAPSAPHATPHLSTVLLLRREMVEPSPATDILFNEAALSSLKRSQLVQLCKMHGVKANGKNVEIVKRLQDYAMGTMETVQEDVEDVTKVHAQPEPTDDDMDDVVEKDSMVDLRDEDDLKRAHQGPRPSDVWEVIEEQTMKEMKDLEVTYKSINARALNPARALFEVRSLASLEQQRGHVDSR